jgi:hypothetical protein
MTTKEKKTFSKMNSPPEEAAVGQIELRQCLQLLVHHLRGVGA